MSRKKTGKPSGTLRLTEAANPQQIDHRLQPRIALKRAGSWPTGIRASVRYKPKALVREHERALPGCLQLQTAWPSTQAKANLVGSDVLASPIERNSASQTAGPSPAAGATTREKQSSCYSFVSLASPDASISANKVSTASSIFSPRTFLYRITPL